MHIYLCLFGRIFLGRVGSDWICSSLYDHFRHLTGWIGSSMRVSILIVNPSGEGQYKKNRGRDDSGVYII